MPRSTKSCPLPRSTANPSSTYSTSPETNFDGNSSSTSISSVSPDPVAELAAKLAVREAELEAKLADREAELQRSKEELAWSRMAHNAEVSEYKRLLAGAQLCIEKEKAAHDDTQHKLRAKTLGAQKLWESLSQSLKRERTLIGEKTAAEEKYEAMCQKSDEIRRAGFQAATFWEGEARVWEEVANRHAQQRFLWQLDCQRFVEMGTARPELVNEEHCTAWAGHMEFTTHSRLENLWNYDQQNGLDEYDETEDREILLKYHNSFDYEWCSAYAREQSQRFATVPLQERLADLHLPPPNHSDTNVSFVDDNLQPGDDCHMFVRRKRQLEKNGIELEPLLVPAAAPGRVSRFASLFKELYPQDPLSEENIVQLGGRLHWNEGSRDELEA